MLAPFHDYLWTPDDTLARSIPLWVIAASAVAGVAAVALLVGGLLLRAARMSPAEIGWRAESPARAIALGVLGAIASTAALLAAAAAFGADVREGLAQMLGYSPSQRLMFASVGILIAIAEESLFRGYLQGELARRIGFRGAYVVTAVVYALWHFPMFQPASVVARLGQGLVYGALRGRDRPLASAAIAHALCWSFVGLY